MEQSFEMEGLTVTASLPIKVRVDDEHCVKVSDTDNANALELAIELDLGDRVGYSATVRKHDVEELLTTAIEDTNAFRDHTEVSPDESVRLFSTVYGGSE